MISTTHSPEAISGMRHDVRRIVARYSAPVSRATSISSISAGSCALTTAYVAPWTNPRRSFVDS